MWTCAVEGNFSGCEYSGLAFFAKAVRTALEAGLPKSKTKFPSTTEPIYRKARALALSLQKKHTEHEKRQSCVRWVSSISSRYEMLREEGEQVGRSARHALPQLFAVSGLRLFLTWRLHLVHSLCLTANNEPNLCDYVLFSLVCTSIFSLCKILQLGVS